jgi:hypothetical protein
MRICEMVEAGLVGKPRRFFFTDAHGWHRGSWLQELWGSQPRRWTSISCVRIVTPDYNSECESKCPTEPTHVQMTDFTHSPRPPSNTFKFRSLNYGDNTQT